MQVEDVLVWNQTTTSSLVCKDRWTPDDFWASTSVFDPRLYYNIVNGESLILVLYVDD